MLENDTVTFHQHDRLQTKITKYLCEEKCYVSGVLASEVGAVELGVVGCYEQLNVWTAFWEVAAAPRLNSDNEPGQE